MEGLPAPMLFKGSAVRQRRGAGAVLGLVYIATMLPKKGDSFETHHLESVGDFTWKPALEVLTAVGPFVLQIKCGSLP